MAARLAAGIVGGLAVGAIVGSQANRGYYGPGYYGEPAYRPVYSNCRTERERYVGRDGYRTRPAHSRLRLKTEKRGGTTGPAARPAHKRLLAWRISAC